MKTLLTALVPAVMTLTGCLCGGWEGQDDQVLRTANGDAMQLCSNGGYSVMMANGTILEGYFSGESGVLAGSSGETGARAFTMTDETDGSKTSTELGGGWNMITLDQVELDHAHVQCTDLETRAWWPNSAAYLPTNTAFARTTNGVTTQLLLCSDGTALVPSYGGARELTTYTSDAGMISIYGTFSIDGIYTSAGTLIERKPGVPDAVWTRTDVAPGQSCQ